MRQCGDKDITHRQTYVSSRTLTRTKVAIQSNTSTEAIILNLNQNLTYTIFFHQPEFYRFPFNSAAMPSVIRTISPQQIGNKLSSFFLELVRRERLNRAENRCNPDADYKFTRCIKQSFIDVIGCKLPWDKHTKGSAIKKIPKHLKNI